MTTVEINGKTYFKEHVEWAEQFMKDDGVFKITPPTLKEKQQFWFKDHKFLFVLLIAFSVIATFSLSFAIDTSQLVQYFGEFIEKNKFVTTTVCWACFAVFSAASFIIYFYTLSKVVSKRREKAMKLTNLKNEIRTSNGSELYSAFFILCPGALPTVEECYAIAREKYVQKTVDTVKVLESLKQKNNVSHTMASSYNIADLDQMSGESFESFCVSLFKSRGYNNVKQTKATGDQGVDILANDPYTNELIAIQCKRYSEPLGNSPIQEVYAGATYYGAKKCIVVTTSTFTNGAKELAQKTGVALMGRDDLKNMLYTTPKSQSTYLAYEGTLRELSRKDFDNMSIEQKNEQVKNNISIPNSRVKSFDELIDFTERLLNSCI